MEFRLLIAGAIAVTIMLLTVRFALRLEEAGRRRQIADTALTAAIVGLVTGRLAAMLLTGTNPLSHPGDILIVRGGVDPVWAAGAAIVAVVVTVRRDAWAVADMLAAPALAGLAGWHAACAVRGACLGTASDLPWAMTEPGGTVSRHPVELYAALLLAAAAVAVELWRRLGPRPALVAPAALTLAAAVRLVTEPMRPTLGSGRASAYLAGVALGAATLAIGAARALRSRGAARSANGAR